MPTIHEVARRAGVSVATVSRVINGTDAVRPETEALVRQAIEATGYRPNAIGRNLRKLTTDRILVLQPSISNLFYARVVRGIETAAREAGYQIMLCDTDNSPARETMYLDWLDTQMADGAILITSCNPPAAYSAIAARHALVHCCEDYRDDTLSLVTMDNFNAARDGVRALIAQGHRRIGFFSVYSKAFTVETRLSGYRSALEEAGIPFEEELCVMRGPVDDDQLWACGVREVAAYPAMKAPPSAIFCSSDMVAIAAIRGLKACGVRVPRDVSILGFDDIEIARLFDPSLSTVHIPKHQIGEAAVALLLARMQHHGEGTKRMVVKHEIISRESTRAISPVKS